MTDATQVAGFIGAALAAGAYVPQIRHLVKERCSAGLSRPAFGVWLAASLLVTSNAVAIRAPVFIVLGLVQSSSTGVILFFAARYAGSYCATHVPASIVRARGADPDS